MLRYQRDNRPHSHPVNPQHNQQGNLQCNRVHNPPVNQQHSLLVNHPDIPQVSQLCNHHNNQQISLQNNQVNNQQIVHHVNPQDNLVYSQSCVLQASFISLHQLFFLLNPSLAFPSILSSLFLLFCNYHYHYARYLFSSHFLFSSHQFLVFSY